MNPRRRSPFALRAAVALSAATALSLTPLRAQQAVPDAPTGIQTPAESFAFEIGHAAKAGTVYSVDATQPASSKLTGQKIRLTVVETTGLDKNTRYFTFATGKHKTVAQLDAALAEVLQRFLATPPPAPGQELGKIGDVQHGGEVRFVVTSAMVLRFDNISPGQPLRTSDYSREDVAGLLAALTGQPPL